MIIMVIGAIVLVPLLLVAGFLGVLFGSMFLHDKLENLECKIALGQQQEKTPNIVQKFLRLLLGTILYLSPLKGIPTMVLDPEDKKVTLNFCPYIKPGSPEWFAWLSRFYNNSFTLCIPGAYDEVEIFEAHKNMSGIWKATGTIHNNKHTFRIGHANEVTSTKIIELVGMYDKRLRKFMNDE